jgi:hypothetical protein
MANVVYNEYKGNVVKGTTVFTDSTTDFGVADITADEVVDGDYARQELAGVTVTEVQVGGDSTGTDDYWKVDATDTAFGPNVTITGAGAIVFQKDTNLTNAPTSIVTYVDFSGSKSSSNGDFTVVWNANGILNFKQGA